MPCGRHSWQAALAAAEVEGDLQRIAAEFLAFCRFEAGLLSERGAGRFGFFHLTFEEYLAGYAIAHTDDLLEQERMLRPHWENPRWREVILLAAGEVGIVMNSKALARMFLDTVLALPSSDPAQEGRAVVLAGRALHDIGSAAVPRQTESRILRRLRETMQAGESDLARAQPAQITPAVRHEAGLVLDALGWLPPDLNHWVRCHACADDGADLLVGQYPVTNVQFELFMQAGGYERAALWGGTESAAWQWRVEEHDTSWRGAEPVAEPEYWRDERFGRKRRGFPVVGVSWYEAQAYCAWLSELLARLAAGDGAVAEAERALVAGLPAAGALAVRLPSDSEWARLAGGEANERYPWDGAGQVTASGDTAAITARANVEESQIGQTSPVAQYPQGAGKPFALLDLAGNVWEWTQTERSSGSYWLRGGSWYDDTYVARVAARCGISPDYSHYDHRVSGRRPRYFWVPDCCFF